MRFPDHVIVSPAPRSTGNSDSEPGITLTDKNDIVELGNVSARKPVLIPSLIRNDSEEARELARMDCA
jgi:hypothetical protein